jgi:uncharacterized protein involved in outer membrane biogenesis
MRKLFKNLGLLILSAAIVLTALGILVQNYMQSREFIEKISESFSESIGGEISVESVDINLLRGFSLDQILLQSGSEPPETFLKVDTALLTYNPFELFLKKLELSSIRLEQPELSFTQTQDGSWWLPRTTQDTHPVLDTGWLTFELLLKDITLNDGTVTVTRKDGAVILQSENIDIEGHLQASEIGTQASGQLFIKKTRMGKHFIIQDMESRITYKDEVLTIPNLTGNAYGGTASGSIEIDLRIGGPEFTIALNLEDLELARLITDFKGKSQWLDGKLSTLCRITGRFEAPELLQGTGTLSISEGTLSGFGFLQELSQIFPEQRFPETTFDSITGNYKIAARKLTIYNLEAVSEDVQVTGAGTVSLNRELNIDMRLTLSPQFIALLPAEKVSQFNQRSDGSSTITFTLSGTLDEPKSNLIEKLKLNQQLNQSQPSEPPVTATQPQNPES